MQKITIVQPDDWHLHLRDGSLLNTTVMHAAARFGRAIIMPNLKPAITTVAQAMRYKLAIEKVLPPKSHFQPLMTLYLTKETTAADIIAAHHSRIIFGAKLYFAGSTTHSESGISKWQQLIPVLSEMEKVDLPLLIHGETPHPEIDIFDREARFIDDNLEAIITRFPHLRIVLEHITTKEAVQFISSCNHPIAATITAHHLLLNRNDLLTGGIRTHYYCLPILKRKEHQEALIQAATSGIKKFFLGSDSAPHSLEKKETTCGCAGIYTSHAAIELYCEVFEEMNALNKLEQFASLNGPDFYRLPINAGQLTLVKEDWQVPERYPFGSSFLIPFRAGSTISWKITTKNE